MFENIKNIFKRSKKRELLKSSSKDTAKERLHLVLMQDRANVSADFLDLMRQEIVEVIKKYIDIDEDAMDVRLATETNEDGTQGAPALYANIPIINIKDETRQMSKTNQETHMKPNDIKEETKASDEKAIKNTNLNADNVVENKIKEDLEKNTQGKNSHEKENLEENEQKDEKKEHKTEVAKEKKEEVKKQNNNKNKAKKPEEKEQKAEKEETKNLSQEQENEIKEEKKDEK